MKRRFDDPRFFASYCAFITFVYLIFSKVLVSAGFSFSASLKSESEFFSVISFVFYFVFLIFPIFYVTSNSPTVLHPKSRLLTFWALFIFSFLIIPFLWPANFLPLLISPIVLFLFLFPALIIFSRQFRFYLTHEQSPSIVEAKNFDFAYIKRFLFEAFHALLFTLSILFLLFFLSFPYEIVRGYSCAKNLAKIGVFFQVKEKTYSREIRFFIQSDANFAKNYNEFKSSKLVKNLKREHFISKGFLLGALVNNYFNCNFYPDQAILKDKFPFPIYFDLYCPIPTKEMLLPLNPEEKSRAIFYLICHKHVGKEPNFNDFEKNGFNDLCLEKKYAFLLCLSSSLNSGFESFFNLEYGVHFVTDTIEMYKVLKEEKISAALQAGLGYFEMKKAEFDKLEEAKIEERGEFIERFNEDLNKLCMEICGADIDSSLTEKRVKYFDENIEEIIK